MSPDLTILILAYDSRDDLERCLPSIARQSYRNYEILVVDARPEDGLEAWLREDHPEIRYLALEENLGYAGGNNLGMREARGEYTLVLNPDTILGAGSARAADGDGPLPSGHAAQPEAPEPRRHHQRLRAQHALHRH